MSYTDADDGMVEVTSEEAIYELRELLQKSDAHEKDGKTTHPMEA